MTIDEIREKHLEKKGEEKGVDITIKIMKYLKENKSIDEIISLINVEREKVEEIKALLS